MEEVFGTAERVRVLRTLVTYTKEFTSRELSGLCGVSTPGVINILTLFERHGFIQSRRIGNSILWKLNGKNYLAESVILPIFEAESRLINHLKRRISAIAKGHPIQKAVIYGSVARGNERPDSDIDLMLIVKEKGKWLEDFKNKLREAVLKLFGNALSILVCTSIEYEQLSDGLKKEISKGIAVLGD
ncbi:MAG: nucleotidyltransferase domain-containing protein [Candidatus Hadarchaeota archaeon]